ncbi:ras-related protein Rab-18A-like isoform X3 [Zootermopsis nevadensis]|uniref:ras-related protein Rab-18A-like isoform X3 n=1 Tax=Zootermopsis nevadensis TaxID=136037 RepID=UPI000B8EA7AB|nr:ras-related protein Rab-18A-like isoform X3 [Zootermopsis nevadensis]
MSSKLADCADTARLNRFQSLPPTLYRDAHGAILMYDITSAESFNQLEEYWIDELIRHSTYSSIGNKIDKFRAPVQST